MLIAACQRTGIGRESLETHLQLKQQRDPTKGRETASGRTWRACWARALPSVRASLGPGRHTAETGADLLIVQASAAGGHSATLTPDFPTPR
ncbi:hypothetical protein AB0L67_30775 [Streptomyces flaveolus]|uniref:hypothetical protein n=1 Tax=Streptomyces flaveolus TaxID=67297 RepID=UPI00341C228D